MLNKIPYINLIKQSREEKKEIFKALNKLFLKSEFVSGDEVEIFEKNIRNFLKIKYCVALNSGTDALTLGLHLLGVRKGDEVITPPNSFVASTASIVHLGAIPVFCDVYRDQNIDPKQIIKKITKKTKAIMPVHLSGRACEMDEIMNISKKYKIPIIEDAAQAIGTKYKNKFVGSFGKIGCFSAHPLKNLNAIGDGGYLVTDDKTIANKVKSLRNHGIVDRNKISTFGHVSRMDNIQAAVLNLRIKKLKNVIKKRRINANLYIENLKNLKNIILPYEKITEFNTYHTFVILAEGRDRLKSYLQKKGINTAIHYPHLIFDQKAYKRKFKSPKKNEFKVAREISKKILTLPINQYLSIREIKKISNEIKNFYQND
ncbi:MAG: transcriptional regulator [Gammaproteobacteria bacterium]|nr:transcriptional regulator [Gammaproteobacteria bacterium]